MDYYLLLWLNQIKFYLIFLYFPVFTNTLHVIFIKVLLVFMQFLLLNTFHVIILSSLIILMQFFQLNIPHVIFLRVHLILMQFFKVLNTLFPNFYAPLQLIFNQQMFWLLFNLSFKNFKCKNQ
jgi:hypothetical protein